MNPFKFNILTRLLILSALALGLTACGGGGDTTAAPVVPPPVVPPPVVPPATPSLSGTLIINGVEAPPTSSRSQPTTSDRSEPLKEEGGLLVGQGIISLNAEFKPDGHVTLQRIIERYPDLAIEVKDEITSQGPFLVTFGNIDTSAATLQALETLRIDPAILDAEPLVSAQTQQIGQKLEPNDPQYTSQRDNYDLIGLPTAWATTTGSPNVCVSVIDGGFFVQHPDLSPNLLPGYDAGDNDADPNAEKSATHGTHVAGIVAGVGNNRIGVAGVAWGSRVVPVKIDQGPGSNNFLIAKGIQWAAGATVTGAPANANQCKVINISLGFYQPGSCKNVLPATSLQEAIDVAEAAGIVVVAAAGNEGEDCAAQAPQSSIPANLNNVISVASVTSAGERAYYSNQAPTNFISAPGGGGRDGGEVMSTYFSDESVNREATYNAISGTSMASPMVAGVVALMFSKNPGLTPAQVRDILARTADDKGTAGRDDIFGHGIVRADKAVAEAAGAPQPVNPLAVALPSSLQLNGNQTTGKITVSNRGNQNVAVTFQSGIEQENTGGNWLTVTFPAAGSTAPFDIDLTADRAGLQPGRYRGRVEITTSSSREVIPVTLVVSGTPDIGNVTVKLLNPITKEVVASTTTNAAASYRYSLSGFPAGSYLVRAESETTGITSYTGNFPLPGEEKAYEVNGPVTLPGFILSRAGVSSTRSASGTAITSEILVSVYDSGYGEPLANATVSIAGGTSTQSDVAGEATFSGVSGAVTITASAPGYSTQTFAGINSDYILFELEPTGTLASPVNLAVTAQGLVFGETAYLSAIVDGEIEDIAEVTMAFPTAILEVDRDRELSIGLLANNDGTNVATRFNIEELEPLYVDTAVSIDALPVTGTANTTFGYTMLGKFGDTTIPALTKNTVALAYDDSGAQYIIGALFNVPIGQTISLSRASLGIELDDIVVGQIINFAEDGDGNSSAQSVYEVLSGFSPTYAIQFHEAPTLSAPVDNTVGVSVSPNFQFAFPTGSLVPSALVVLSIEDSNGFLWEIFLPPATTSFQLPVLSSGGLAANTTYTWTVEDFVIDGFSYNEFSLDFGDFFDKTTESFSRTFTTAP